RHGIMGDDQPQIIPGALTDDFFRSPVARLPLEALQARLWSSRRPCGLVLSPNRSCSTLQRKRSLTTESFDTSTF
ncbi:hypothetical protein, partial [Acidithiobacillus ferridurans]|uniref:hypothetical protein n=1 Tax=Acidithiobacillus ferridurans TaxID=1232575 RepID=UPI001C071BAB